MKIEWLHDKKYSVHCQFRNEIKFNEALEISLQA